MIFHDKQCYFHDYLMNDLKRTSPFSGIFSTVSMNTECSISSTMYLNKPVCNPCMHFEKTNKLESISSQKTSCLSETHKFVCLTASFLAFGGFVKLFKNIP